MLYVWYFNLLEIENGFELLNAYSDLQQQFVNFVITQRHHYTLESEQVNAIMEGTAGNWKNYKPALAQVIVNNTKYMKF